MEILRAVGTPLFKETLARQGLTPAPLTSAEYDALLRAEFTKMQKMFRDTAVKLD
jgi:tripartite-type tricarboxylate transporter receptor subunit TctC